MTSFSYYRCVPSSTYLSRIYLYALLFIYEHLWESLLFMRIFWISSYLWSSVRIFPFYENLIKSLLIFDHLWESLLFMRIFLNFFLFVIICENLFESFLIYDHLWVSFPFMRIFFNLFFFITICFNYHNLFQLSQSFFNPFFFITTFLNLLTACNTIFMKISQRMNFII